MVAGYEPSSNVSFRMAGRAVLAGSVALLGVVSLLVVYMRAVPLSTRCCLHGLFEAAFYLHYRMVQKHFCSSRSALQIPADHDPRSTKRKLVKHLAKVDSLSESLLHWFTNASSWDEVHRGNLLELFAYAIWYKSVGEVTAAGELAELEDLIGQLEQQLGRKMPDGYNPQLRFMSHLWDPLKHVYRPFLFYVVMEVGAWLCYVTILAAGFQSYELNGVRYYTYKLGPQQLLQAASSPSANGHTNGGSQASSDAEPLVFLHGVGAGLLPYLALVFHLPAIGRPLIMVESKHVSMRLIRSIPTVDNMADTVAAILTAHGARKAAVMAHSYGTMVASRLVLKHEAVVSSLCLLDPVCMAMYLPDLVKNFLYTRHDSGCLAVDLIMALVSTELYCSATFSRHFCWSSINLWDEHIPERTLVVLSGRDILSPTAQLCKWLQQHTHAQVLFKPHMPHAGILVNFEWQSTMMETFKQVMQRSAGSAAVAAAVTAAEQNDTSAVEVAAAAAAARHSDMGSPAAAQPVQQGSGSTGSKTTEQAAIADASRSISKLFAAQQQEQEQAYGTGGLLQSHSTGHQCICNDDTQSISDNLQGCWDATVLLAATSEPVGTCYKRHCKSSNNALERNSTKRPPAVQSR